MSGFQETPNVAYYQVEDFSGFGKLFPTINAPVVSFLWCTNIDNEEEFFDLCTELHFEPFAPFDSHDE